MVSTTWQLAEDSALRYERILVPAILGPAAQAVVDHAPVQASRRILDLGCGTGAAIQRAARSADPAAGLIGIDNNRAMLGVASSAPLHEGRRIVYCAGNLIDLPLRDASCDLVLCAQTLQFVRDHASAAREMRRVLAPSGTAIIGLWSPVEENPYFGSLIDAITAHIGERTAAGLKAIFNLSGEGVAEAILGEAGFSDVSTVAVDVKGELGELTDFIPRHITATPMAAAYAAAPEEKRRAVVEHVVRDLTPHRDAGSWFGTWVISARP